MNRFRGSLAACLLAALTATGCAASSGDAEADSGDPSLVHAMKSCGIAVSDRGAAVKDAEGKVAVAPIGTDSVNIDTDPLSVLQAQYDDWGVVTAEANAAAQGDPSWQHLATIMTDRIGLMNVWLTTRQAGIQPSSRDANIGTDIDKANSLLAEYNTICSGLALRLSDA